MSEDRGQADLAEAIDGIGRRLDALQAELRRGVASPLPSVGEVDAARGRDHSWLPYLERRARRTPRTPRLLLEALFLIGCAIAAGAAELEPVVIAAVMGGAWLLTALLEWAASRADRVRDELLAIPPPVPAALTAAATPAALEETQFVPVEELAAAGGLKLPRARDGELEPTA